MFKVTTQYKTNANGTAQILAKGQGRQVTVGYRHGESSDWNHGDAAGALLLKLGLNETDANSPMTHSKSEDGTKHTFNIG